MLPALYLAQAAVPDTLAALSPEAAIGGGAVGALGLGGAVAGALRYVLMHATKRIDLLETKAAALEAALAELRGDLRVAGTENKHLREVLHALQATLERSR
jgi:hypothetical protein